MSFPRAKIQRFNDVLNSVPSPTKYDPKIGDKVKGGCILKADHKSSTFSDTASATSSKSCLTPIFRTPQLPRRHNCLGTSEKESHSAFKSISLKSEELEFLSHDAELEELKALRVECSNKTETINDMEKHIQELKTMISENEKSKAQLEAHISELETAKSNLECVRDNETCEQIIKLKGEVQELERQIEEFTKNKAELLAKLEESEKKNNKLEELNLDFERKIISLEGTIEQLQMEHKNKEKLLADLRKKQELYKMNHTVSLECLQGKISTLENEIVVMDGNKSKNEATIFGLETEISKLNGHIEKLMTEKLETEKMSQEAHSLLREAEAACKTHNDTITGLEMELENRVKELQSFRESRSVLKSELAALKLDIESKRESFEREIEKLTQNHEKQLIELNERYRQQESLLDSKTKDFNEKSAALAGIHAEEILQLQNDYESKLLAQMQENTEKVNQLQCQLDEKDAQLKEANTKHSRVIAEWERKYALAEEDFAELVSKMKSEHLEHLEEMKESFSRKLKMSEMSSMKTIDQKNKEIDMLTQQYKEILGEVQDLVADLENKDTEIHKIKGINYNLNSRVKLMLEEIKLLNAENYSASEKLKKMTKKYNEEFNKNEQLSCKLGELDSKISQLKTDLNKKVDEWKRISDDLRKSKGLCEKLQDEKSDLERAVTDLQEEISQKVNELRERKTIHEEEMQKVNEELIVVKNKCRKFEIVMGNTHESLEAVRQRLIESEKEVEHLSSEKIKFETKIILLEGQNLDLNKKYEDMLGTKVDLEAALDDYLTSNKELEAKCVNLETLCGEFEIKIKELTKLNEDLEKEKLQNINEMSELIRKRELELIETERITLDQVEKVSQVLTEKLEFFMRFSTGKVRNLTSELKSVRKENEELTAAFRSKNDEYDNLVTDNEILKTTVEIAVKESEDLKQKCEEQYLELKKLEDSILALGSEKRSTEERLAEKEMEYADLVQTCESLREQLKATAAETDKLIKNKNDTEIELVNLRSESSDHKMRADESEKEVQELKEAIHRLEVKIREKDTEIASCQEEKMICLQEIQTLTAEKEELLIGIKITEKKLTASLNLVKELEGKRDELEQSREKEQKEQNDEITRLMTERERLESALRTLKEEQEKLKMSTTALEEVEERKNYYKSSCLKLDKLCSELTEENTSLKNDFNEIHSVLQDKEKKLEELQKRCADLESLIGPFREQLEQYENERLLIENDREELRKQHLEQAAKLGHQNHKQKIQHVVNLKNSLLETRKENEKLTLELKNMKKKLQKLQEELGQDPKRLFIGGKRPSSTPFKGKENTTLLTPSAGIITPMTVKQEPMSPGSPLRNRNQ